MTASTVVEVRGHIIDSLILAKILDVIVDSGADYRLLDIEVGRGHVDASYARIEITLPSSDDLASVLEQLHPHGAHPVDEPDADWKVADTDGVLPEGFYSTTNLATRVKVSGEWLEVSNPEMDCALVVDPERRTARTLPMHRVRQGHLVVVGNLGVAVQPLEKPRGPTPFEFMSSDVSSEKPKALIVSRVSERIRAAKSAGGRLLAVCGPAVVHTGAGPDVARLVREGWIDVLFAGNGFAVHDIESSMLGTSLGVSIRRGHSTEGGHANHLRTINEVRRAGSISAAVDQGVVTSGVMYECVRSDVPFVLGGSVRDDGPLPDVITDVIEAQEVMRDHLDGVSAALMLASTLHAIATGNLLTATVETFCVDINQSVVTKLADRGSHQVLGIVTDVGLFARQLVEHLCRP